MARGKFNKRGGGPRLDAVNAEEIEIRNQRLAELEEERAQRRADAEEEEAAEGGGEDEAVAAANAAAPAAETPVKESKKADKIDQKPAVPVTTEADHRRNLKKLEEVRKRREAAEAKRQAEEELAQQEEEEQRRLAAMTLAEHDNDEEDDKKKKKKKGKSDIPKLDKITIKKMKPAQMKEALKARGLEIQGNAKELQDRLLKYEAER